MCAGLIGGVGEGEGERGEERERERERDRGAAREDQSSSNQPARRPIINPTAALQAKRPIALQSVTLALAVWRQLLIDWLAQCLWAVGCMHVA